MADELKALIPSVDVPDFVEPSEEYDTEYRPSLAWDLKAGDFVRTGGYKVPMSSGIEAYKVWCVKAIQTERFTCLAYADDIGAEIEAARREDNHQAVELALSRTIEEALMVNPRTRSVEGFTFSWNGSEVHLSFTVNAIDEEAFTVDATLEGDE